MFDGMSPSQISCTRKRTHIRTSGINSAQFVILRSGVYVSKEKAPTLASVRADCVDGNMHNAARHCTCVNRQ